GCDRSPKPTSWGDSYFNNYVASCKKYHQAFSLPLIWWQTPLGVASTTAGKNKYASQGYRDNRVPYFFGHVPLLIDAGGIGAVFSAGQGDQADISTDITADGTHQFKAALTTYNAAPAPLN